MAFTSAPTVNEPYKFSLGPLNVEIQAFSMLSSDTTGTVTASRLSRIDECIVQCAGSVCQTAVPTVVNGTVPTATLTFADPAAACTGYAAQTIKGYIFLIGR